jgi:thymidylate synthase ThyX
MTQINAKIIADSKNEFGNRITTMVVTFPRFILAELNTHRMMSRNSASSRAIPFEKMIESVQNNPFIPIAWQKDHKGMQGIEYITNIEHLKEIEQDWLEARDNAVKYAKRLSEGFPNNMEDDKDTYQDCVTKQLCNRLLEPFMWHTVIVTATEWENFFALRCPQYEFEFAGELFKFKSKKDLCNHIERDLDLSNIEWLKLNKGQAEIHMMALAEAMWDAYNESTPKELKAGEWHIPFGDDITNVSSVYKGSGYNPENPTPDEYYFKELDAIRIKIATALCARVSYTVVGEESKEPNYENDIKLHDRLAESGHWSPFEHCAKAMNYEEHYHGRNGNVKIDYGDMEKDYTQGWSGNFRGFIQYRKMFANENIKNNE